MIAIAKAFVEVDRVAERFHRAGDGTHAIELIVKDNRDDITLHAVGLNRPA
jgi:hypothetical protein